MPYDVLKRGDKYVVVKETTGEVIGTHESRAQAVAQMRAIYASESPSHDSPGTMMHGGTMMLNSSYEPEPITHAYVNGRKVPVTHTPPAAAMPHEDSATAMEEAMPPAKSDFKAMAGAIKKLTK